MCFWLGLKTKTGSISNLAEMEVGERVIVAGQRKGTIRFAGNTQFAPGIKPLSSSHIFFLGCVGTYWLFLYKPLSLILFVVENCILSHCRSFCIHDCHLRQQLCQFAFIITLTHYYQSMLGIQCFRFYFYSYVWRYQISKMTNCFNWKLIHLLISPFGDIIFNVFFFLKSMKLISDVSWDFLCV